MVSSNHALRIPMKRCAALINKETAGELELVLRTVENRKTGTSDSTRHDHPPLTLVAETVGVGTRK